MGALFTWRFGDSQMIINAEKKFCDEYFQKRKKKLLTIDLKLVV